MVTEREIDGFIDKPRQDKFIEAMNKCNAILEDLLSEFPEAMYMGATIFNGGNKYSHISFYSDDEGVFRSINHDYDHNGVHDYMKEDDGEGWMR